MEKKTKLNYFRKSKTFKNFDSSKNQGKKTVIIDNKPKNFKAKVPHLNHQHQNIQTPILKEALH